MLGVLCGSEWSAGQAALESQHWATPAPSWQLQGTGGLWQGAAWSSPELSQNSVRRAKGPVCPLEKVSSSKERVAERVADRANSESSIHQRDGEASLRSTQEIKHQQALWPGMDVSTAQLKALPQVKHRSRMKGDCSFPQLSLAQTGRTISEVTFARATRPQEGQRCCRAS